MKELENYTDEYVAEMVWKGFKGEIPEGMKIAHIDGNKANNALANLKLEPIGGAAA